MTYVFVVSEERAWRKAHTSSAAFIAELCLLPVPLVVPVRWRGAALTGRETAGCSAAALAAPAGWSRSVCVTGAGLTGRDSAGGSAAALAAPAGWSRSVCVTGAGLNGRDSAGGSAAALVAPAGWSRSVCVTVPVRV